MLASVEELRRRIAHGGQVDELDRSGRSALFYAAMDGDLEMVAALLSCGAQIGRRDKEGKTALHFAAAAYRPAVVDILIRAGAVVDAQDIHGNTPLFDAVFESRERGDVIKVLLAAGADRHRKSFHDVSPHELANVIANYEVSKFFR